MAARADAPDLAQVRRATSTRCRRSGSTTSGRRGARARRSTGRGPSDGFVQVCVQAEELCWGDAGLYLRMPTRGARRLRGGGGGNTGAEGALPARRSAATAPRSGAPWRSPSRRPARIRPRSRPPRELDGDEWVLNGTKIFCTARRGRLAARGRLRRGVGDGRQERRPRRHQVLRGAGEDAGHEARRPREEARHPRLGHRDAGLRELPRSAPGTCSAAPRSRSGTGEDAGDKGFKGAMATFDASRPIVAAMAVGVGRAALDFAQEELDAPGRRASATTPRASTLTVDRARRDARWRRSSRRRACSPGAPRAMMTRGHAQQPRGLDGQGQGGARRHAHHPEGRRAPRPRRLLDASCWSRSGCATRRSTTSTKARSRSTS